MGLLTRLRDGRKAELRVEHVVGRASGCDLHLAGDPAVSSQHARLRWTSRGWEIRNLASTNGVLCDGVAIGKGDVKTLDAGCLLQFGSAEQEWQLTSAKPPAAFAVNAEGTVVRGSETTLALPPDEERVTWHLTADGEWVQEDDDGITVTADRSSLELDGQEWTLHLPKLTVETAVNTMQTTVPDLGDLTLTFDVAQDGETVDLTVTGPGFETRFPSRVHHQLLLTLAEERLAHADDPELPIEEHGWMGRDQLLRQYRGQPHRLYVHCHRAREKFAQAGIAGANRLIEMRSATGARRIGVAKLVVNSN